MGKQRIEQKELYLVRSQIVLNNQIYAGYISILDDKHREYVLSKLERLKQRERELMSILGYR
jgi:hypothetical protein